MSTIEVNLDDYLTEDDKRRIAEEEFRAAIRRATATSNDVERFIGNIAWVAVWDEAETALTKTEKYGPDLKKALREKITEVVGKVSFSSLIWDADSILRRKKSIALEVIEEVVKGSRGQIEQAIHRLLDSPQTDQQLLWGLEGAIVSEVQSMFYTARERIGGRS